MSLDLPTDRNLPTERNSADTSERKRRAAAARSQNCDDLILPELIAALKPHERGLRRWSVMRAIRAARARSSKAIPQKFEEQVERTFRRFCADAADAGTRVCTAEDAPFYRRAETAGEVWALVPGRAEALLDGGKSSSLNG